MSSWAFVIRQRVGGTWVPREPVYAYLKNACEILILLFIDLLFTEK